MDVIVAVLLYAVGLGLPTVVAGGYFAHRRRQEWIVSRGKSLAEEVAARRAVLATNSVLRAEFERWEKTEAHGGIPSALCGTGAVSLGQQEAVEACRGSADDSYDCVLLAEPNNDSRRGYIQAVEQLPGWKGKIIEEPFRRFPGFQGKTPSEALKPDFLSSWAPDLRRTVLENWLPTIRLHDKPRYLKLKVSTGGSGVTAVIVIQEFRREYPGIPVYIEMVLDEGDGRRTANIPELLDLYYPLVDGICLYDNRRDLWASDQAQALLGPASITAPWIDRKAPENFNALGDVHRKHKFSTIRVSFKKIKVESRQAFGGSLPGLYYTDTSQLEFRWIQAILDVLHDPRTQSLPLTEAKPQVIYGIGPIVPDPCLTYVAPRVYEAVRPQLGFNRKLAFASIGKPLAPQTRETVIAAVALVPLAANLQDVKDYVTGARPKAHRFIDSRTIRFRRINDHAGPAEAA